MGCVDKIIEDSSRYMFAIYENCWKYINNSSSELKAFHQKAGQEETSENGEKREVVKIILQTTRIMLCMLPQLIKNCRNLHSLNGSLPFDTHVEEVFSYLKIVI